MNENDGFRPRFARRRGFSISFLVGEASFEMFEAIRSDRSPLRMEAHCLRRLQGCPEVVGFFYEVDTAAQWLGVLELCAVELWDVVRHCGCVAEEARWYGRRMAQAILVLHGHGIVHRDVKCENFMLTEGQEVKLIDFGTLP